MGLDKHLFLMQLQDDDRVDLTSFISQLWKHGKYLLSRAHQMNLLVCGTSLFQLFVTIKTDCLPKVCAHV